VDCIATMSGWPPDAQGSATQPYGFSGTTARRKHEEAPVDIPSPIFPHVEDSEDEDIGIGYFVANFIVTHQDSAYFTRLKFRQPRSQSRVAGNPLRACDQLTNDATRGRDSNGMQKFV